MDLVKLSQLLSTSNLRAYKDDDYWIDRLCHRYSVIIFSIFAILVTTKAYIGDPIDCWAPPEFKASYERYAETLCFVNGTYYISATEIDIPIDPTHRYSNRVRYYQWTPFILLLQAFTIYLPRVLWMSLNTKYGINLRNLVDAAKKYESVDSFSNKQKILVYICKNMLRSIQYNEYSNKKQYLNSSKKNYYLNHKVELSKMMFQMSNNNNNPNIILSSNPKPVKSKKAKSKKNKENRNTDDEYQFYTKLNEQIDDSKSKRANLKTKNLAKIEDFDNEEIKKHSTSHRKHSRSKDRKSNSKNRSESSSRMSKCNSPYFIIDPQFNEKNFIDFINKQSCSKHYRYETPLNLLQSKITNISKKHILNSLSSGYEINQKSKNNFESNELLYRPKKPLAYLVNRDLVKSFTDDGYEVKFGKNNTSKKKPNSSSKCQKLIPNISRTYLFSLYLLIKLFYLLVSVGQVFFLNRLIGNEFYRIGLNLLRSFVYDIEWPHMDVFPRMTLCEIYIREVGTIHPYLIQCVLRINLFNEVIFVLVWYWLVFVIFLTGADLVLKFLNLLFGCSNCRRKLFALKYLELIHLNTINNAKDRANLKQTNKREKEKFKNNEVVYDNIENEENYSTESGNNSSADDHDDYLSCHNVNQENIEKFQKSNINDKYVLIIASEDEEFELFEAFCESNFNNDTIFALKVIEQNASSLIVSEIIEHLWLQFKCLNCVYSNETNDFLLKKFLILNKKKRKKCKVNFNTEFLNSNNNNNNDSKEDEDYDVEFNNTNNKTKSTQNLKNKNKSSLTNRI